MLLQTYRKRRMCAVNASPRSHAFSMAFHLSPVFGPDSNFLGGAVLPYLYVAILSFCPSATMPFFYSARNQFCHGFNHRLPRRPLVTTHFPTLRYNLMLRDIERCKAQPFLSSCERVLGTHTLSYTPVRSYTGIRNRFRRPLSSLLSTCFEASHGLHCQPSHPKLLEGREALRTREEPSRKGRMCNLGGSG